VRNSLVQVALKLMAPGVPDIYQGTETWDLSLVDPDNRRRVDFDERSRLLESVEKELAQGRERALARWLQDWHDGRIKLAVTRALLELRGREATLFAAGDYVPCTVEGPRADELIAFQRSQDGRCVLTAAQRFPVRGTRGHDWGGTRIHAARHLHGWADVLTGRSVLDEALDPGRLFATLPVAVLAEQAQR
jgi:(1->4)-alpha-D-glucan 1-alpha-D-glucosylmutase